MLNGQIHCGPRGPRTRTPCASGVLAWVAREVLGPGRVLGLGPGLALLAFAPGVQAAAPALQQAAAPDGRPGLGAETPLSDLLKVFRTSKDEPREFLAGLRSIETDVRLLSAGAVQRYRSYGYFELLDSRAQASLENLHAAFLAAEEDPLAALRAAPKKAAAFARMFLDTRFRNRLHVLDGWEYEASEVSNGLAVFKAATDGYVLLNDEEGRIIATRVDLSASLLRALRNDLKVLRPTEIEAQVERANEPAVRALLERARPAEGDEPEAARAALEEVRERQRSMADQMGSALFTTRLLPKIQPLLQWRENAWSEGAQRVSDALMYLPDTPEGQAAPDDVKRLKKSERIRYSAFVAREGLGFDPLNEDLVYLAAHGTDFFWGPLESRPLFDRYLALRGIRSHDHRTLKDRRLTDREQEALDAVRQNILPPEKGGGY